MGFDDAQYLQAAQMGLFSLRLGFMLDWLDLPELRALQRRYAANHCFLSSGKTRIARP